MIDDRGEIPAADVGILQELKRLIDCEFSHKRVWTSGEGTKFSLSVDQPLTAIEIMENMEYGHRIRKYTVCGKLENGEKSVIYRGECIGHKRLIKMNGERFDKIELIVDEYTAIPSLRSFAVYSNEEILACQA